MNRVATDKSAMRLRLSAARAARSGAEIETARAGIRAAVLAHITPTVRWVAAYLPLRTEPGSIELLDALAESGRGVLVPVTRADRDLDWTSWPGSAPVLGLDAITTADLVLVPALAVDGHGSRLGRGGGSYDRALTRVRAGVPIAALVYPDEVVDAVPTDAWDVPVHAVVTPAGWVDLATSRPSGVDGE